MAAVGIGLLVLGFALGRSNALLGLRLAVVGAVAFAFGGSGIVALELQSAIDRTNHR